MVKLWEKLNQVHRTQVKYSLVASNWGGGNYADNEDGPVFCNLCVHRGTIKTNYDSLTGTSYIDFYYRINHGVVEIWISPKKQFPNIISILVMRNSFNHWTVGQLEMSRELPAGLVDF